MTSVPSAPAGAHRLRRRAPVQGRHAARSSASSRCARSTTYAPDADDARRGDRASAATSPRRSTSACATSCAREPVEDFRIDFEDGYGNRPDDEEDGHAAVGRATQVAAGTGRGHAAAVPRHPHQAADRASCAPRALRTLDLFLTELLADDRRRACRPTSSSRCRRSRPRRAVAALVDACSSARGSPRARQRGALQLEIMVETHAVDLRPRRPLGAAARCIAPATAASRGAHFGTYDYTARCDITAAHQQMRHPACDFAKHMMKVALAGTGVMLSDGATNIMPVARTRGADLTDARSARTGRRARRVAPPRRRRPPLARQRLLPGLGPPSRAARRPATRAVYAFFLDGLAPASERLRNFVDKAAQATLVGDVFDDAATGQGLLNYFLRGIAAARSPRTRRSRPGLSLEEIRGESFVKIMEGRRHDLMRRAGRLMCTKRHKDTKTTKFVYSLFFFFFFFFFFFLKILCSFVSS